MKEEQNAPQVTHYLDNQANLENASPEPIRREDIPLELLVVAERLKRTSQTWNPVEFITPSPESIRHEQETFFAAFDRGEKYIPTFEYPAVEGNDLDVEHTKAALSALIKEVRAYRPSTRIEKASKVALYHKLKDDLASMELFEGIRTSDEVKIKSAMATKYAGTDPYLIQVARERYQELTKVPVEGAVEAQDPPPLLDESQRLILGEKMMDAQGIRSAFEYILSSYGILRTGETGRGFQVVVSPNVTGIDVRDKSITPMTIYIPEDREVSALKLLELCRHEIEGHARQSMNGLGLAVGGGALKVDDETLYEGLAKRLDEDFNRLFLGTDGGVPSPFYTLAVARAESGGDFHGIFSEQLDMQLHILLKKDPSIPIGEYSAPRVQEVMEDAKKRAWMFTYRVMRGHTDMSNKEGYACAKDLAYLRGWLMDKQLVASGNGHINEAAILQTNALPLLGHFSISPDDIQYPYRDVTREYCFNVLLPQLTGKTAA